MTWSRVDLPEPDGPTMAASSPRSTVTFTSLRAPTGRIARVLLADIDQLERGRFRPHDGTTTGWSAVNRSEITSTKPSEKMPVSTPTSAVRFDPSAAVPVTVSTA